MIDETYVQVDDFYQNLKIIYGTCPDQSIYLLVDNPIGGSGSSSNYYFTWFKKAASTSCYTYESPKCNNIAFIDIEMGAIIAQSFDFPFFNYNRDFGVSVDRETFYTDMINHLSGFGRTFEIIPYFANARLRVFINSASDPIIGDIPSTVPCEGTLAIGTSYAGAFMGATNPLISFRQCCGTIPVPQEICGWEPLGGAVGMNSMAVPDQDDVYYVEVVDTTGYASYGIYNVKEKVTTNNCGDFVVKHNPCHGASEGCITSPEDPNVVIYQWSTFEEQEVPILGTIDPLPNPPNDHYIIVLLNSMPSFPGSLTVECTGAGVIKTFYFPDDGSLTTPEEIIDYIVTNSPYDGVTAFKLSPNCLGLIFSESTLGFNYCECAQPATPPSCSGSAITYPPYPDTRTGWISYVIHVKSYPIGASNGNNYIVLQCPEAPWEMIFQWYEPDLAALTPENLVAWVVDWVNISQAFPDWYAVNLGDGYFIIQMHEDYNGFQYPQDCGVCKTGTTGYGMNLYFSFSGSLNNDLQDNNVLSFAENSNPCKDNPGDELCLGTIIPGQPAQTLDVYYGKGVGAPDVPTDILAFSDCTCAEPVETQECPECINTGTGIIEIPYSNNKDICDLSAGTYCVTKTDLHECSTTCCFTVTEPNELVVSIVEITNPTCKNCNSLERLGTVKLEITGGTTDCKDCDLDLSGYEYRLDDLPYTPVPVDADNILFLKGIELGNHRIQIKDCNCCIVSIDFEVYLEEVKLDI